ncbi:glycine betaine/L-proline ABC transporter substrate-binding protein ProX [Ruegeria sp.]|uniref:glycine betaine/L-proline ABC transporter substrate-binding protein ProX n=1 Tax=Ruegeria sp. TaxID=1879320 RepID=UPI00230F1270|nr:glycine betaine/L-proline ABC transporter substrate-binding protein ProX [Ruegeria sp.]MDA7965556.1 glycine betaine/L-proline ABC transporter substrate-binding protein ProX [Ruegeria sp.]
MKRVTPKGLTTAFSALAIAATALTATVANAADYMTPGEGVTVQPMGPGLLRRQMEEKIFTQALQDLGYEVKPTLDLKYALMFLSVASGDGDFAIGYAHPIHIKYFEKAGGADKLTMLEEPLYGPMPQAYYIDKASYDAGIRSIEDLKKPENAARFDTDGDGKADLVGCQPGWGCERAIEHHLDAYELRDHITHVQGEYAVVMADVIARAQKGNPVLYFAFSPYWVHDILRQGEHVERIEVPFTSVHDKDNATVEDTTVDGKNVGHIPYNRHMVANKEFLENNPAIRTLFEVARIDIKDIEAQNRLIHEGEKQPADIDRHVETWISDNRAAYDSWLKAARDAAAN